MRPMGFIKNRWVVMLGVFAVGVLVGFCALSLFDSYEHRFSKGGDYTHEWEYNEEYRFVSPLLSCGEEQFDHVSNDVLRKLEDDLESYLANVRSSGRADSVSVYFRQLKGGPWLGINYETEFIPASLLKVPLAMAVYKTAEKNPTLLNSPVFYESGDASAAQYFKNVAVQPGKEYLVRDLVEATLIHSDNNAAELLAAVLTDKELQDTYTKLGIDEPTRSGDYSTNVHYYASFFRILFNATYLSPEDSNYLLDIMTRSTFTRGLVAGVPEGIPVSHKFGERAVGDSGLVQLHDCGIVYHPERPYLICIMTQGKEWNALSKVLSDISSLVWKSVD